MNIGYAVKLLRTKRKMSQQTLAKKLNVTQGFLSLVEKNDREPTSRMLEEISKKLAVPKELLLLLACDTSKKDKVFSKQLKKIANALDDMLMMLDKNAKA